jgi:hypothetical protein
MTCRELLDRFVKALDRDELDWEALHKLAHKCGEHFALEAARAVSRKAVEFAVTRGWALYRGSKIAGGRRSGIRTRSANGMAVL